MDKQVQIYSVNTNSFYNANEERLSRKIRWIKNKLDIVKEFELFNYLKSNGSLDAETLKKFNMKSIRCIGAFYRMRKRNPNISKFIEKLMKDNKGLLTTKKYKNFLKENKIWSYYNNFIRKTKKTKGDKSVLNQLKSELAGMLAENNNVRILNPKKVSKYNVISLFSSSLTRTMKLEEGKLSKDLLIVRVFHYSVMKQLIRDGFNDENNEHYIFLTASAGQIRNKKLLFVKKSLWNQYKDSILCGLSIEDINNNGGCNTNKYLAYLALNGSATDEWDEFDIDKAIVINDFTTTLSNKEVDFIEKKLKTDEKGQKYWEIDSLAVRGKNNISITHNDGCGWVLPSVSKKNIQFRMAWFKGLVTPVDYLTYCKVHNEGNYKITDMWGKEWDLKDDDIKYVFTESQFKMAKFYKDWDDYKTKFKENHCTANICKIEESKFKNAKLSYQMWQTLTDIKDEEIEEFTKPIAEFISDAYTKKDAMLKMLGVTKENMDKNYLQEVLELYPALLKDEHCKKELSSILNARKKDAKFAKFAVDAKNTFIIPDIFAWMQYSISGNKNPDGLLKDGEVYCRLYKQEEVLIERSPHLYREHAVRNNVIDKEKSKWFKSNGIYTSCHDLISKVLQFDNDGDEVVVVADKTAIDVAKRNMKDIVSLYYEMGKAEAEELNADNIYNSLTKAFKYGNIGQYSNKITTLWNSANFNQDTLEIIKILCALNNWSIDAAKTLEMPRVSKEMKTIIDKVCRDTNNKPIELPYFFIFAKDKDEEVVEKINNSTVNRICAKIEEIKQETFNFNEVGVFRKATLMKNKNIEINQDIIAKYEELNKDKNNYFFKNDKDLKKEDIASAVYYFIRQEFEDYCKEKEVDIIDATDMIIKHIYDNAKDCRKTFLFDILGDIIVKNIKENKSKRKPKKGYINCKSCNKSVKKDSKHQLYCDECSEEIRKEKDRERKKKTA